MAATKRQFTDSKFGSGVTHPGNFVNLHIFSLVERVFLGAGNIACTIRVHGFDSHPMEDALEVHRRTKSAGEREVKSQIGRRGCKMSIWRGENMIAV